MADIGEIIMSDGPYRSLKRRQPWRRVAQLAENINYSEQDISAQTHIAILKDIIKEIPRSAIEHIQSVFIEEQGEFFTNQASQDLESIRREVSGFALGPLLIDFAQQQLRDGNKNGQGFESAMAATIKSWGNRAVREAEEHYWRHRNSTPDMTIRVKQKIQRAVDNISPAEIAKEILTKGSVRKTVTKHKNLDDGVPL